MKTTGVIRKLDELGRITLPIELRRSLDLDVKDGLEITVQDDCIILKKAECADIFTGSTDDLLEYEGKKVSRQSVVALAKLAGLNVTEYAHTAEFTDLKGLSTQCQTVLKIKHRTSVVCFYRNRYDQHDR